MSNSIEFKTQFYHLKGLTPILGSQPSDPYLRTNWIAKNAPSEEVYNEENGENGESAIIDKGQTVFLRDAENNDALFVYDYTICGYFKAAMHAMSSQLGISNVKSKVNNFVKIGPRHIYLMRDGEPLYEEDAVCERPLRASTARFETTTLAASEMVNDPWEMYLKIVLLPNKGTAQSNPITFEAIEAALSYGQFNGLGQWRNGGMGRFIWEKVDMLPHGSGREGGGWMQA